MTNWEATKEAIFAVFNDRGCEEPEVSIKDYGENTILVEVVQMYEYVDMTFQNLQKISTILGTDRINILENESEGGCESCDYGSRYKVSFTAENAVPLPPRTSELSFT